MASRLRYFEFKFAKVLEMAFFDLDQSLRLLVDGASNQRQASEKN